jgi:hypothetical protein
VDDLKVSLRLLLKSPGFSLAAIIVLALGIGLNAAMFSVVYAFTMAGRPFPEADRIVQLYSRDARTTTTPRVLLSVYQNVPPGQTCSDLLAAPIVGIGDGTESRRAFSVVVSANYFDVLGVPLVQGRTFSADEDRPGQDIPVAIVSHAYWKRTGFDPGLVGKTVRVNERPFTVVGIAPRGFTGTMSVFGPELFFPLGVFHTLANDFEAKRRGRSSALTRTTCSSSGGSRTAWRSRQRRWASISSARAWHRRSRPSTSTRCCRSLRCRSSSRAPRPPTRPCSARLAP